MIRFVKASRPVQVYVCAKSPAEARARGTGTAAYRPFKSVSRATRALGPGEKTYVVTVAVTEVEGCGECCGGHCK